MFAAAVGGIVRFDQTGLDGFADDARGFRVVFVRNIESVTQGFVGHFLVGNLLQAGVEVAGTNPVALFHPVERNR